MLATLPDKLPLLLYPGYEFSDFFLSHQCLAGVVMAAQGLFVEGTMKVPMAVTTEVQATGLHLGFIEVSLKPVFAMALAGNEMVEGQGFGPTAQLAASVLRRSRLLRGLFGKARNESHGLITQRMAVRFGADKATQAAGETLWL
jgi:hypothetical protein